MNLSCFVSTRLSLVVLVAILTTTAAAADSNVSDPSAASGENDVASLALLSFALYFLFIPFWGLNLMMRSYANPEQARH
eukprot:CAMPEP_0202855666 /NCGR_PEP_ID=MMETSP1389-20130828/91631_1 /ASSEMBLY_ACC=CAM_ASM_000865 /TAXON_ID=302021 /ORGANISM="Rhodomonas sp., Strain CCMP768" /LENGTH=78 /DNA_ID=CAMNT_0049534285 /DNA_START=232 /DNA_END=468 /DNA_ORIENTATION=-